MQGRGSHTGETVCGANWVMSGRLGGEGATLPEEAACGLSAAGQGAVLGAGDGVGAQFGGGLLHGIHGVQSIDEH